MAGNVPAARSDSPGWIGWLTFTVLFLFTILVSWITIFAYDIEEHFLVHVAVALVLAALLLPAWAIFRLDRADDEHA